MKKTDLSPELQTLLTSSFDLLIDFSIESDFAKERFNNVRQKEEWTEVHVELLVSSLTLMVTGYNHRASKEYRVQQDQAKQLLKAFLNFQSRGIGQEISLVGFGWVKLSDESIFQLKKAYTDIYLKRHSNPKAQQIIEALPWIEKSGETMAWFVARIMSVVEKNKALRKAFESDLLKVGLKIFESKSTYAIIEAETSEKETREMTSKIENHVSEQLKKGGFQ